MRSLRAALFATLFCTLSSAETQLTKVNIAVFDRQGRPAPGLQSADFQIQENGKARRIVFFRFAGETPPQPVGADAFSNRGGAPLRVTVVLLDLLSDYATTGPTISDQLTRSVDNLNSAHFDLSQGFYLYLLTSTGQLYPVHGLSRPDGPISNEAWRQNLEHVTVNAGFRSDWRTVN